MTVRHQQIALRTSLAYLAVCSLYIVGSDWLLMGSLSHTAVLAMAKGLTFVLVTSALIFVGLRSQLRRLAAREGDQRQLEALLTAREAELKTVFDSLDEGVLVATTDGRLVLSNPAARGLLDAVGEDHPLGQPVDSLWAAYDLTGADGLPLPPAQWPLQRILRGETLREEEVRLVRRDGGARRVHSFSGALARDPRGQPLLAIVRLRDVTARKESEREITRLTALNRALSGINQIIVHVQSREELFEQACRIASAHASISTVWVALLDPGTRRLKVAAQAGAASAYVHAIAEYDEDGLEGKGPVGRAVREGRTVLVDDAREDPSMAPWREQAARHGLRSIAALPIRFFGETVGAYVVYATEPGVFRDQERQLLDEIVATLSFALEHLDREQRREKVELELAEEAVRRRVLMEQSRDGVVVLDDAARVVEANFAFGRLLRTNPEELRGRGLWELDAEHRREDLAQVLSGAGEGKGGPFETRLRRSDGTLVDVDLSASPVELSAGRRLVYCVARDVTGRKQQEAEREITVQLLRALNQSRELPELLNEVTGLLKQWSGCEAVGLRLSDGEGFPYLETNGFPSEFVAAETDLCLRDAGGAAVRDPAGNPVLECMCGNVLCGRFDPSRPFFTARGSFWTNGTTKLLAGTSEADRQARTRNRCNGEGYESVALVAIRTGAVTHGLLQFNDRHENRFDAERIGLFERLADQLAHAIALRLSEHNLRRSEETYRTLATASPDAVVACDARGSLTYASLRALQLFGHASFDEVRGHALSEWVPDGALSRAAASLGEALTGQKVEGMELELERKDHTRFLAELSAAPIRGESGTSSGGYIVVIRDVTVRRREEEQAHVRDVALRSASSGIALTDLKGRLFFANDAFLKLFGFATLSQALGQRPPDFMLVPDRDRVFAQVLAGGSVSGEGEGLRTDGTRFPFEFAANPVRSPRGEVQYAMASFMDVTERKQAERRLATQAAVSRVLAEASSLQAVPQVLQALCEAEGWDIGTLWQLDRKGERLCCSAVWRAPRPELDPLEARTRELVFARGEGFPGRVWQTGVAAGVAAELSQQPEYPRKREIAAAGLRSAFAFPLLLRGELTGVLEFGGREIRVLDSKLAETVASVGDLIGQFLERQRARDELTRFVSVSPTVLYALSAEPGLPVIWSSAPSALPTGPAAQDGRLEWLDSVHPDDRARVAAAHPVPYEIEHQVLEYRLRRADGTYSSVRDEKRLLRDERGRPWEIVGSWADVTRQVELESQVRQAQKMESLGQLAGGIAHDFNNIVGAILGNAELARGELPANHPVQESLEHILSASARARSLIQQILTFSRRQALSRTDVDLGQLAEESRKLLRASLPAGVELSCTVDPSPLMVRADASQIHQVILNLVTNAWHALEERSGRIDLEVQEAVLSEAQAARIPGAKAGRHARLTVRDNGKGMDAATLERVFDPFFTTKEPGKGTGLGMSVVHGIVQAHHGAIQVTSAPGAGTTVEVFLAAIDSVRPVVRQVTPLPRGAGQHVLVVDDEAPLARVAHRMLTRLGYRVTSFTRPAEALEAFRRAPGEFDLVVTDLNMPNCSGIELANALIQLRAGIPIVLVSGYLSESLRAEAKLAGIDELVLKPFSAEDLSAAVRRQLG
ncbi:MAG: PAS domain S-box protein [Myxococcales bacterium]